MINIGATVVSRISDQGSGLECPWDPGCGDTVMNTQLVKDENREMLEQGHSVQTQSQNSHLCVFITQHHVWFTSK